MWILLTTLSNGKICVFGGFGCWKLEASFCGSFILSNFAHPPKVWGFSKHWKLIQHGRGEEGTKEGKRIFEQPLSAACVVFFQLIKIERLAGNPESMISPPK